MEILFSRNSKKQLSRLNSRIKQKLIFTLEKLKNNRQIDIIKLKNKKDEFRIRAGNYRMQLQKINGGFLITKIGKRENFYLAFL